MRRAPLSLLAAGAFLIASVWVTLNVRRWEHRDLLQWDTDGYYLYLPAAFIHHDLAHLRFLDGIPPGSIPAGYRFGQGAVPLPGSDRFCDKYSMGTAVFELPFFLAAHAWCLTTDPAHADGYAPPYQLSVALSAACWACAGLLLIGRFLRRYATDGQSAMTILALGFGTNLFFYSSFAPGMAHPYLFFLCALLIERTDAWYRTPSARAALVIGSCIGLATLTRPTCLLLAIIPLAWGGPHGLSRLRTHARHLLPAGAIAAGCLLPQLLYWRLVTGHWIFYSYGDEGFAFAHPHTWEGLFSFRKGWFVYTPLALLAFAGVRDLVRDPGHRAYASMLLIFYVPFVYVTFCWVPWWYGGSFGSRVMIDTLPLLALPLLMLVRRMRPARPPALLIGLAITACIVLNLFQQWQYQRGIIHYEAMTFQRWCQVFGRTTSDGLPVFP